MPVTNTPLRYPGGKSQLTPFVLDVMRANDLFYGEYAEPFAGGAGIACTLLFEGYVSRIHINDLDPSIFAFWESVVKEPELFARRVRDTPVTMDEWRRQKAVQSAQGPSLMDLGFSTFFLNRTNRSGIINGGVIGGFEQKGDYPIDCRFNKANLLRKIERLAAHAEQISVTNFDAMVFLKKFKPQAPSKTLINIDPPYYIRGPELYGNWFNDSHHRALSKAVDKIKPYWMVTYDSVDEIRNLYAKYPCFTNKLRYSAQVKRYGEELLVLDPRLNFPASLARISEVPRPKRARVIRCVNS